MAWWQRLGFLNLVPLLGSWMGQRNPNHPLRTVVNIPLFLSIFIRLKNHPSLVMQDFATTHRRSPKPRFSGLGVPWMAIWIPSLAIPAILRAGGDSWRRLYLRVTWPPWESHTWWLVFHCNPVNPDICLISHSILYEPFSRVDFRPDGSCESDSSICSLAPLPLLPIVYWLYQFYLWVNFSFHV